MTTDDKKTTNKFLDKILDFAQEVTPINNTCSCAYKIELIHITGQEMRQIIEYCEYSEYDFKILPLSADEIIIEFFDK